MYIKCSKESYESTNSIDIKTSVYDAVIHLSTMIWGTLIVVENGKLVGIISRKDLLKSATWEKYGENSCQYDYDKNAEHSVLFWKWQRTRCNRKIIKHEIDSLPVLRKENGKLTLVGRFTKTNAIKLYYQELKNKNI